MANFADFVLRHLRVYIDRIPLAWLLARKRFWGRSFLIATLDLPVIIPHSAAGIALLTVIGRRGYVGRYLDQWWGIRMINTEAGIVAAMAFVSLPFLVAAARVGFEATPARYERVARTLGASSRQVFFTVSLPLARRSIFSA